MFLRGISLCERWTHGIKQMMAYDEITFFINYRFVLIVPRGSKTIARYVGTFPDPSLGKPKKTKNRKPNHHMTKK